MKRLTTDQLAKILENSEPGTKIVFKVYDDSDMYAYPNFCHQYIIRESDIRGIDRRDPNKLIIELDL